MKRRYIPVFLTALGLILGGAALASHLWIAGTAMGVETLSAAIAPVRLVIDPGHGGEDGGAVSLTGVSESQINLAIALCTEDILALYGRPAQLLRREDISLHSADAATLREKKISDLHNRAAEVEREEDTLLVSIHQNSFPMSACRGTQVFFAPTEGSEALAQRIQQAVRQNLQPENDRQAKQIPDTVYLMNHVTCPAVLVECGFLTNPEEEALLRTEVYQTKFSAVLACALLSTDL